jgi:glycosyltransferase involved in cell wall biosynthesis
MPEKDLTVVIPAYNEEKSLSDFLPRVIDYCTQRDWKVIVVDDGSCDGTQAIAESLEQSGRVTVIHHKVNRGYGGAIKTGIRAVDTRYLVTIDADGQHHLDDIEFLFAELRASDADMIVGSREGLKSASRYRDVGKRLIRFVANLLLDVQIHDLNSGMKVYDTKLAQKYLKLCPDSMAFSEVIALIFISQRHLIEERPIRIRERIAGVSTINTRTAFETMTEIINLVILFNPMRIFLPISIASLVLGLGWGIPIVIRGDGVSVGAMLAIINGILFFFLALLAEQISLIRRDVGS